MPAEVVTPLVPGRALRIVANGSVDSTGPDGRPGCRGGFSSEYAIAAITVRCEALVGVFLGDTLRAMPPSLDFMGATRDLVRLEPLLQQPFLVGSGFTDGGQMKQFVIPAGATRLYLSAAADPASAGSFLATVSPESAATPELPRSGVARAAGFAAATLSAGSIASLFGSQFAAESTGATSVPLPSQLGQTRVWFNLRPAPLYFVSPGQVNAQVPWELAGQTNVQVVVTRNGAASLPVIANLAPAAPGIFLIRENAGVVVNASTGRLVDRQTSVRRGEALVIYASGLGAVAASSATGVPASSTELEPTREPVAALVSTNGQASELQMLFAGSAPGFIGVNQVNAIVPLSVPPGLAALRLRTRGVDSNEVLIAIE